MPTPGSKSKSSPDTRPSGNAASAAEGARRAPKVEGSGAGGRIVPSDGAKQVLDRYGNDPIKMAEGLHSLETKFTQTSQEFQRAMGALKQFEGLADFVERDPITNAVRLKASVVQDLAAGGRTADTTAKEFRESIENSLRANLGKDKDPAKGLATVIIEAAQAIAKQEVASIRGTMDTVGSRNALGLYMMEHQDLAPLTPYVDAWLAKQPLSVRQSVGIPEAIDIVSGHLRRAGKFDEVVGTSSDDDSRDDSRGATAASGGKGGKKAEEQEPTKDEQDQAIKDSILGAGDSYTNFLRGSRKRELGLHPEE